jgi:hypothetical protein
MLERAVRGKKSSAELLPTFFALFSQVETRPGACTLRTDGEFNKTCRAVSERYVIVSFLVFCCQYMMASDRPVNLGTLLAAKETAWKKSFSKGFCW